MVDIIPAVLTADPDEAQELLEKASGVTRVQIDIVDGVFADNKSIDPVSIKETNFDGQLDFHLLVKEPVNWVAKCLAAGADRIIGQIEMMSDQYEFVTKVLEQGGTPGLAVNLETPIAEIEEDTLLDLEVILLMSYSGGVGGQSFDPKVLTKIKQAAALRKEKNLSFKICIDGGIDEATIGKVTRAGADEVVVGRRIFAGEVAQNVAKYQKHSLLR